LALDIRQVTITESQDAVLDLSDDEATTLQAVGRQLAGTGKWWGSDERDSRDASVLTCIPTGTGRWRVRVSDAVGVIGLPSLQVSIEPKIPTSHLLYLLEASGEFPRLAPQRATSLRDRHLWELILNWYVAELETLLRRGLLRDYEEKHEVLRVLRGSIDPVATAHEYYRGHLAFDCLFDDFDFDTAPNRLLSAAARAVVRAPTRDLMLRRRARRALARFENVGDLRADDLHWQVERRAGYYSTATTLARHIIRGVGRTLSIGKEPVTTFLIRTPEMVEAGLRTLLQRAIPERKIEKRGMRLVGSTMTLNPDLVFGSGEIVGDVKYKLPGAEWSRPDLYQLVAFATGFGAKRGLLIHFASTEQDVLPKVLVGDVKLEAASWLAVDQTAPEEALSSLVLRLRLLLDSVLI
jgi:5-methylcytosine-specific restriction enzyme subunit McrC